MSRMQGVSILTPKKKKILFKKLKNKKAEAYYREGSFSDEVIWQGRKFVFPSPLKSVANNVWIFRSVISNVRTYVEENRIREKQKLPVNYWNPKAKSYRGKITATDVDHAYWRIAFLQGVINAKVYKKGLTIKDKSLRLAALANLASNKEFQIIKDGVLTEETIVMKQDPLMKKVYDNIRYTCYELMMKVAEVLGDEFICYKTDCIYYKDKPENRKAVQEFLDKMGMEWKQLIEPERPKKEEANGTNH